ncbi:unnamed protein product, partial [marine sediment metagenome]
LECDRENYIDEFIDIVQKHKKQNTSTNNNLSNNNLSNNPSINKKKKDDANNKLMDRLNVELDMRNNSVSTNTNILKPY